MSFVAPLFPLALAILVLVALSPVGWRLRKVGLLLGSYAIYAAWDPRFLVPLLASTLVDWYGARRIAAGSPAARRRWIALSLLVNLGLLVTFRTALGLGWTDPLAESAWFFPLGISFYTFQTLSYTLDVYRGDLEPCQDLLDFALFVGFFPQLLAGPIVRAGSFLTQCRLARRPRAPDLAWGVALLVMGLFLKVVLGDFGLGPGVDAVLGNLPRSHTLEVWLAATAFLVEIYLDFAGYSLCAVGAARCLGFDLPRNFYAPFAATSFAEFWRRWHITFTAWVRDYVFLPLSRSRPGRHIGVGGCAVVCLTLVGLWHGPGWTATLWGLACGIYLALEGAWTRRGLPELPVPPPLRAAIVMLGSAPFAFLLRGPDAIACGDFYAALALGASGPGVLTSRRVLLLLGIVTGTFASHQYLRKRTLSSVFSGLPAAAQIGVVTLGAAAVLAFQGAESSEAFFYLQY